MGTNTIGELLSRACRRFSSRVAVVAHGRSLTYGALLERASRLSNALSGAGLRPGDRIAAMLEDRTESLEVYLASAIGGFPIVHVNDRLAAPEVAHIVRDAGVAAFIHTDGRSAAVSGVDGLSGLQLFSCIGTDRPSGAVGYEELLGAARPQAALAPRAAEDLAIVGYSSGTTGFPKGAMISQSALTSCVKLLPAMYRISPYGRCAFTGTLSFVAGIWGVIYPHLYMGGTITFLHPYTPDSWVAHLEQDRSTFTYAPSPLVPAFIEAVDRRPGALNSLESVLHSASPLPREHAEELVGRIGDRYVEVWGMTEGVAPFSATTREDWRGTSGARDIFTSAGRPFPITTVRSRGPDGQVLAAGEQGELVVDSEILFSGYLGDTELTAASFSPLGFHTGDVGALDEQGYVYVTGRKKDMIISGGMNVYPAEVEAALTSLYGVAECCAFGMPDQRWGEAVAVAVVAAPGATLAARDVIDHVQRRLASYKKPSLVYFVDALPRNASLKVRKDELRSLVAEGSLDGAATGGYN